MREIHQLLDRRWVVRKTDPDLYYRLKDSHKSYKSFFQDKLGYQIIMNPLLIKVEKIPGQAQAWMGIQSFKSVQDYLFLCYLLIFLEEMDPEDQFVLSQITDHIKNQDPKVDWTHYQERKTLIRVLNFLKEEDIIKVSDGDDSGFRKCAEDMEVLYENTGTSKYFMRRFAFDISDIRQGDDIERRHRQAREEDRGLVRRHRVYRKLLMGPVVYEEKKDLQDEREDQDYLYIKNQRSVIAYDIEENLEASFHLHKNGAFVLIHQPRDVRDALPSGKNISDIILQMNKLIRQVFMDREEEIDHYDQLTLAPLEWEKMLEELIKSHGPGWSKTYRQMSLSQLKEEIEKEMTDFGLIRVRPPYGEVSLLAAAAKLVGDYSPEYWQHRKENHDRLEDK